MNLLLDTHALIWFSEGGSKKLSSTSRESIENRDNEKFVSIVTFWEIAIKTSLGKLSLNRDIKELSEFMVQYRFILLPVTVEHTVRLVDLIFHHHDPFDRILIAQAISENFHVVTKDSNFSSSPIKSIW